MKDTGSRIVFRSVDDYERLRGTNLAWFGVDELTYTPEEAWLRLEGRLRDPKATRLCGFAVWTPKGFDWVYRKFMSEPVEGYEAIIAKPFENRHLLDKVPDFYERLKKSYDENFYQQEVLGQYLSLHGRAGVQRVPAGGARDGPGGGAGRAAAVGAGLQRGPDVLGGGAGGAGDGAGAGRDRAAAREHARRRARSSGGGFRRHGAGVVIYGDASGNHAADDGDVGLRRSMREFFAGELRDGAAVPGAAGEPERAGAGDAGELEAAERGRARRSCWWTGRCKELIKDFEQVTYKADSNLIDKEKDRRRTHLSDALGYLVWQECRPRRDAGRESRGDERCCVGRMGRNSMETINREHPEYSGTEGDVEEVQGPVRGRRAVAGERGASTWCGGTRSRWRFTRSG